MKFLSIGLKNFGRFRGQHFFTFKTNEEQNVILVKAENDRGKTTLFYAINYALYGGSKRIKIADWVNLYEAENGSGETSVEIVFENDDEEYRIVRTQKFLQTTVGEDIILEPRGDSLSVYEDNKPISFPNERTTQDWIEKFLPYNASQFCFFDGEKIQQYMKKTKPGESSQIKKAIETALGITELRNANEDVNFIFENIFKSREEKLLRASNKDETLKKKLDQYAEEKKQILENIKKYKNEMANAEKAIKQYDNNLGSYKNIAGRVSERKTFEFKKQNAKDSKSSTETDLKSLRGSAGLILLEPLITMIYNTKDNPPSHTIFESEVAKKILAKFHEKEITNCVCDTKLTEEVISILSQKQIGSRTSIFQELKKLCEKIKVDFPPSKSKEDYISAKQRLSDLEQEINDWEDQIKKITQEIRHTVTENLSNLIDENKLNEENIMPKITDKNIVPSISRAITDIAKK